MSRFKFERIFLVELLFLVALLLSASFTYQEKLLMKEFEKQYGKFFMGEGVRSYFEIRRIIKEGDWKTAYKKLIWLSRLYPNVVLIYEDLFIVCYKLGKLDDAKRYFKKARDLGTKNSEIIEFYKKEFTASR